MPDTAAVAAFSALWLGLLGWLMHGASRQPRGWVAVCAGCAFAYVVLSLRLDVGGTPPHWLNGLRWALFGGALYSFVRYRVARRAVDKQIDKETNNSSNDQHHDR